MPRRWYAALLLFLLVALVYLQFRLWFGDGGRRTVIVLQQRVQTQARENERLRQRNDALAAEVAGLKSGEGAVEERARSELGMIKPGETFYRVVEPRDGAPPPDKSDRP